MKKSFMRISLFIISLTILLKINVFADTELILTNNTKMPSNTTVYETMNASTMEEFKSKFINSLTIKQQAISINYIGKDNASRILYGDLNGDNQVNKTDAELMKKYIVGSIIALPSVDGLKVADVNTDGTVNSIDLALLKRFIAGTISKLPASIDFEQEISDLVQITLSQDSNRYNVKSLSYNISGQQGNYKVDFNLKYNVPKNIYTEYSQYNFECNKEQTVNFYVYDDSNQIISGEQCKVTITGNSTIDSTVVFDSNGKASIKISDIIQENVVLNIETSNGINVRVPITFANLTLPVATITEFTFEADNYPNLRRGIAGKIDEVNKIINVAVPIGTDLSKLIPTVRTSYGSASVSPLSGQVINFNSPVKYTVTAYNSTSSVYTVIVTVTN